jgi:hypothetical protein
MPPQFLAVARTLIGLLQGGFLYFLYSAVDAKFWPATDPYALAMMIAAGVAVPLLAIDGLGNLRPRTLGIWLVLATLLCCGIAAHRVYIGAGGGFIFGIGGALFVVLFILHALIVAGQSEGRVIAGYPRYFDVSWKLGIQCILALLFVGALWGLLWLGAALFDLIKISLLSELIKKRWFTIPVTTLALAYSLHVTDVRGNLVTGARTLLLTLLSWLLPVMTVFGVLFLAALPVVGLEPLWSTRHAAGILLASVAALVFLINAAYQDGNPDTPIPLLLRQSRWLASIVIVGFTVLAGYGLLLRVEQYGWTPERVIAVACVLVAACYAAGYALAAILSRLALRQLELTNVLTAYVIVAVLLALQSRVADPVRISVSDQVDRLISGKVAPEKFDIAFLRFRSGRYGKDALQRLADGADGPQAVAVAERAKQALASSNQFQLQHNAASQATPASRAANINVISPAGAVLPDGFLQMDWKTVQPQWQLPGCLLRETKCEAVLVDLDGDGRQEILLFNLPAGLGAAFQQDGEGHWHMLGTLTNSGCPGVREALRAGKFQTVTPPLKDVEAAGQQLRVNTNIACKIASH